MTLRENFQEAAHTALTMVFLFGSVLSGVVLSSSNARADTLPQIWYLKAGANGDGKTPESPLGSSLQLSQVSNDGDTIFLLASDSPLNDGLNMKKGQSLIGLSRDGKKPVISNKNTAFNDGCGVILRSENSLSNVSIKNTLASGIYAPVAAGIRIEDVDVSNANLSNSLLATAYSTLPGSVPHGGMIFVHSGLQSSVVIANSTVRDAAGLGIASIASENQNNHLTINNTSVEGGSRIGFYDAAIATLIEGPDTLFKLATSISRAQGRLSRAGRNLMIVASSGGKISAQIKQFFSGKTGQDGIVGAVMQSPSEIDIHITDSKVEGAGQMNIEGSLINLPPEASARPNEGKISIAIENSIVRNAGAVPGFEDVAANIWLGGSQFIEEDSPAQGEYFLKINGSTIEGAGRSGIEFGARELLSNGQAEKSAYKAVLTDNIIVNNGQAEIMIFAPNAQINAKANCWGSEFGLVKERIVTLPPVTLTQLDASNPIICSSPN